MTLKQENRRLARRLAIVAIGMFGFAFALVPFYHQIHAALEEGALGEKSELSSIGRVDVSRTVTLELDSNAHNLPWRFLPLAGSVKLHPGERATVEYEVINVRERSVTGQALPSYAPSDAGEYLKTIDCFCFTPQTLAAGETRRMAVTFVVDPALPKEIDAIALSYTFFEVPGRGGKR